MIFYIRFDNGPDSPHPIDDEYWAFNVPGLNEASYWDLANTDAYKAIERFIERNYGTLDGEGSDGMTGYSSYEIGRHNYQKAIMAFHNVIRSAGYTPSKVLVFRSEDDMVNGLK